MKSVLRQEDFTDEELKKCKDSPVYFYNKYLRKEGQKELTETEYKEFIKKIEYQINMPLKLRRHYKENLLLQRQMYDNIPKFIKK